MAFNELTDAERERLDILSEECGEIVQAIGKIGRHGYNSYHPSVPACHDRNNRRDLEREIGDFMGTLDVMITEGDLDHVRISDARAKKVASIRMRRWTHHQ